MQKLIALLALVLVVVVVGCESDQDAARVDGDTQRSVTERNTEEMVVPLSKVPASVVAAGEKAVPGIVFKRVERQVENGVVVYDLLGSVKGKTYEVEVTADGKVLDIEEEDGDDDDEDEDDDDDGDDDDDEDGDDDKKPEDT